MKNQLVYLALAIIQFGCKELPPDPSNSEPKKKIKYSWSIDTLSFYPTSDNFGNFIVQDIWGASDTNIFVAGYEQYTSSTIWHYYGSRWERESLFTFQGGKIVAPFSFFAFLGFASNDIYAFGSKELYGSPSHTRSLHYNGEQWSEVKIPDGLLMYNAVSINNHDFYVGGTNGQLFHYLDGQWTVDTIKHSYFPELPYYNVMPISYNKDGVYAATTQYNASKGRVYCQFILYNNGNVIRLDSTVDYDHKWGGLNYWVGPSGRIYSSGDKGVFVYLNNHWQNIFGNEPMIRISGTTDERIFGLSSSGNVYRYDGINWEIIFSIKSNRSIEGKVWCSQNDIFVAIYQFPKSYVFHGIEEGGSNL